MGRNAVLMMTGLPGSKAMLSALYEFIPTKHVDPHRTPPWIT
jgi:hypothetical protein